MEYLMLFQKMKEKKVTIDKLARLLNCHRNSIYNRIYGKGNCDFSIKEALKIRNKFFPEIGIEELFNIKQEGEQRKKDLTADLKLNDDGENQFEDKCWYIEKWYDEDLELALKETGIPITKENVIKLKTACKGIFDDKSERNSMLCQIAEETFQ